MEWCKCCGGRTRAFASLDFSRSCEDPVLPPFPPSGEMVPYVRCETCGFIFTSYFDAWTAEQMAERIYNADYHLADPDFAAKRPIGFAHFLMAMLASLRSSVSALDYGGGEGSMARTMRGNGFDFDAYDPFFSDQPAPSRRFDLVTSFEVVEHSPDPAGIFETMLSYLKSDGAILFSTALQPRYVTSAWSYIAPRNGHISIHTVLSLRSLASRFGMRFCSINHTHLLFRQATDPVARAILRYDVVDMLWRASRRDARSLLEASLAAAKVGYGLAAFNPRHFLRLLLTAKD